MPIKKETLSKIAYGIGGILAGYAGFAYYMYSHQEEFVFGKDTSKRNSYPKLTQRIGGTEINLITHDNYVLQGWIVPKYKDGKLLPIKVYYSGRNENVYWLLKGQKYFSECSLCFFNYRGMGKSTGIPSEDNILKDSITVFDYVKKHFNCADEDIGLIGHSLGTGISAYVATQRKVKDLILVAPYDSIGDIAKQKHWYLPINYLLKHKFNTIHLAEKITCPTFFIIAHNDHIISNQRSKAVYHKINTQHKKWVQLVGFKHNQIFEAKECINNINEYYKHPI